MAKEYREKNPPVSRSALNGSARSPHGPLGEDVIKLYEDLSNFLVTKVVRGEVPHSAFPDFQEKTFHCTYTYVEPQAKGPNPSETPPRFTNRCHLTSLLGIQFTLRHTWAAADEDTPVTSTNDLKAKMEYIPVNLENESDEFRAKLEFFKTPFLFERDQMHVFMKTMNERLSIINEGGDESESEDQINDDT